MANERRQYQHAIQLVWHGEAPDADTILKVRNDIQNLGGLSKPSDLIFHTCFVGETIDGPCVSVWGEADDDEHFHCKYMIKAEFVSLKQLEMEEGEHGNDL